MPELQVAIDRLPDVRSRLNHVVEKRPVVPPRQVHKVNPTVFNGPAVNPEGHADVVANQSEVGDLLTSLGL